MAVSSKNVRLITTITKATDAEIKRLASKMGVTDRVLVSIALSTGLKMIAVQLDPIAYLTPKVAAAMASVAEAAGDPSPEEAERMEGDLVLATKADKSKRASRKAGAKSRSKKT